MAEKRKMQLKVKATLMLTCAIMLSFIAGAFMYATGNAVVEEGFTMFMVSHTEYRYGEPGQIVARLVDYQGDPIAVDNCTATILYPDKTIFADEQLMSSSVNISGDHYYAFTTPNGPEGVYEYQATCYWTVGAAVKSRSVTNSFHLSSAFTSVLNNLTQLSTDVSDLSTDLLLINASLSQDLSDLSAQLNTNISTLIDQMNSNTSTILTYLTDINETVHNITVDLDPVLAELEKTNNEILFEDDFQEDLSSWSNEDGNKTNTVGYLDVTQAGMTSTVGGFINLSDPVYLAYTDAELANDVTFEYMYYKTDDSNYFDIVFDGYGSYAFTIEDIPGVDKIAAQFGSSVDNYQNYDPQYNGTPPEVFYIDKRVGEWNLIQVHFYDYDSTSGNVSVAAFYNGMLIGRSENVVAPSFDVGFWIGDSDDYLDNFRIYKGAPQSDLALAMEIRSTENFLSSVIVNGLAALNASNQAAFTVVNSKLDAINLTVDSTYTTVTTMSGVLNYVNTTTSNTYDYVTGTLATNVNNVLTQLGVINATVNRIEANTVEINTTVATILQNQEDEVYMTVFSG